MKHAFPHWLRQRHLRHDGDNILPLVAAAGVDGISRKALSSVIQLEPQTLDGLLAAMVDMGMLTVNIENGVLVYRSPLTGCRE